MFSDPNLLEASCHSEARNLLKLSPLLSNIPKLEEWHEKKLISNLKKKLAAGEDLDSDDENYAIEFNL